MKDKESYNPKELERIKRLHETLLREAYDLSRTSVNEEGYEEHLKRVLNVEKLFNQYNDEIPKNLQEIFPLIKIEEMYSYGKKCLEKLIKVHKEHVERYKPTPQIKKFFRITQEDGKSN